jgi:plastocyanin
MHLPTVIRTGSFCISLALAVAACDGKGSEPPLEAAGKESAGAAPAEAIPELNGCSEALYEDRSADEDSRVIAIAASGLTFTPKCMIVDRGQRVRWEGSLAAHPLAPGNPDDREAGTLPSPIVPTVTGRSVEFTFEEAGTFPYYCTLHAFGDGRGMAGAIHVR